MSYVNSHRAGARGLMVSALVAVLITGTTPALASAAAHDGLRPAVATVTLYVDKSGTSSTCTGPGTAACPTISEGVTAASAAGYDGELVDVDIAAGTYDESVTVSDPNDDTLSLVGASADEVTLDDGDTACDLTVSNDESGLTVSGMTITDGEGGVCYGTSNAFPLSLTDDDVTYDTSSFGAGLVDGGDGAYLTGDTFSHDMSHGNGGAVEVEAGANATTLTADEDTFSNDTAAADGGAIYDGGSMTVESDTFTGNSAEVGGAIWNGGTMTVEQSTLSNDMATSSDPSTAEGGAIYNQYKATLDFDTIDSDSATGQGGGVYTSGLTTIGSSTFGTDSAPIGGGLLVRAETTVANSTFDGDSATTQGGDIASQSELTATESTVANGTSPSAPGIYDDGGASMTLGGDIIDKAACVIASGGTVTDLGYNDESDNTCGLNRSTVTNSHIGLAAALAANGSLGPQTLAIGASSSAIDLVPVASCPTVDERGDHRPGVSASTTCDAGAYEYQGSVTSPPSAPLGLKVKGAVKSLKVSWKAPHSTGSDPILGYRVYCGRSKSVKMTHKPSATTTAHKRSATIKHLAAPHKYYCRVVARSSGGSSPPSTTKSATTRK